MSADEPVEITMARIDALASFAMDRACPNCDATVEPLSTTGAELLQAVGIDHDPWCPDYVSW